MTMTCTADRPAQTQPAQQPPDRVPSSGKRVDSQSVQILTISNPVISLRPPPPLTCCRRPEAVEKCESARMISGLLSESLVRRSTSFPMVAENSRVCRPRGHSFTSSVSSSAKPRSSRRSASACATTVPVPQAPPRPYHQRKRGAPPRLGRHPLTTGAGNKQTERQTDGQTDR
jgi:hypothetical protein